MLVRLDLPRGVAGAVSLIVHYLVLALGFLLAMAAAGIEMSRFALLAGAFGVGIGFGLQNVVNNFVSGLILIFERPIQVGDTVEIGSVMGTIGRIGIRSSTVRTFDGADVIVPNADLISGQVINWTLSDRFRRGEIDVGVAYGTDPEEVLPLLIRAAAGHPRVLESPEPQALFLGFGASSLDFKLRFWSDNFDDFWQIRSDVVVEVNHLIREAGIEIPFPQRDLHLRSVDERAARSLSPPPAGGPPVAPASE